MDDVIEVRADEGLDLLALQSWIEAEGGLPSGLPRIQQFAGGKANLTYLLTFPRGEELVLRRPPLGPVAEGAHDMTREHTVLSRLWRAFDKAPRAFALCQDESVIGAPFLLMERKPGVVIRDAIPGVFGGGADPVANQKLSEVVIDTLVELHAVEPASCDLEDLGHPEGFLTRQVEGWSARWERAKHEDNPIAEEVAAWLTDELPESGAPTLLHNDWRLDNMAVSPDDPGVCAAVYDWDMATRGDPLADVGTLMASWYDHGEERSVLSPMPTTAPGWLDRDTALARYGARSGRDMTPANWYVVFGTWKLGVVLQQIYIRWLRGQTQDSRFEPLGEGARALFRIAADRRR
ncbi:MAG TPA: phosphotransferase family protein [Acidimicrobiia bacterium]|nr:phosphotransferase family protein [Acidimicrobiia bacterium]